MKPANSKIQSGWEFPPFKLDKANATLWRDGKAIPLRPKSFTALCYLLERNSQLVTKDELLDAVWQNRCVGEAVLKVCINELRQALVDDASAPTYLITVPRRGYRFAAPVTEIQAETSTGESPISIGRDGRSSAWSGCWIARECVQTTLLALWQKA